VLRDEEVCQSNPEGAAWRSSNRLGGTRVNQEGQEIRGKHKTSQEDSPLNLTLRCVNFPAHDQTGRYQTRITVGHRLSSDRSSPKHLLDTGSSALAHARLRDLPGIRRDGDPGLTNGSARPIALGPGSFLHKAECTNPRSVFQCEIHPSTEVNLSPALSTGFGLCFAHLDS
jgi:hypothetical protein